MFFLKSLIYPIFSPKFYKEAVKKGMKTAWGVFALFTLLISIIYGLVFAAKAVPALINLPTTLQSMPEFTIENNQLTVNGTQPIIFNENGQYFAIDTTGQITDIPQGYNEGVLLTRNFILVRSSDAYGDQQVSYNEVLESFGRSSISINRENVTSFARTFGTIFVIVAPVFIFINNFIGRLISIFLIALLGLIVLNLMGIKENAFNKSFIIAVYASIPVLYLNTLLKGASWVINQFVHDGIKIGTICCFLPILFSLIKWGFFWGLGAYGIKEKE